MSIEVKTHPAARFLDMIRDTDVYIRKRKGEGWMDQHKRAFDQLVPIFERLESDALRAANDRIAELERELTAAQEELRSENEDIQKERIEGGGRVLRWMVEFFSECRIDCAKQPELYSTEYMEALDFCLLNLRESESIDSVQGMIRSYDAARESGEGGEG